MQIRVLKCACAHTKSLLAFTEVKMNAFLLNLSASKERLDLGHITVIQGLPFCLKLNFKNSAFKPQITFSLPIFAEMSPVSSRPAKTSLTLARFPFVFKLPCCVLGTSFAFFFSFSQHSCVVSVLSTAFYTWKLRLTEAKVTYEMYVVGSAPQTLFVAHPPSEQDHLWLLCYTRSAEAGRAKPPAPADMDSGDGAGSELRSPARVQPSPAQPLPPPAVTRAPQLKKGGRVRTQRSVWKQAPEVSRRAHGLLSSEPSF